MRRVVFVSALAGVLGIATSASAEQIRYVGIHPVAESAGGGFCHIEAAHVHVYRPMKANLLYRQLDDQFLFVGDPVPFVGYDGPKVTYYGHHPVPVELLIDVGAGGEPIEEYCYLHGPHYHAYGPPPAMEFELKGSAYWYVGGFGPTYTVRKKTLVRINGYYEPLEYPRPVVTVEPPSAWVGVHGQVGGGVGVGVAGGIEGGVAIEIPEPPSVDVSVGLGVGAGVFVDGDHDHGHRHKKARSRSGSRRHWDDRRGSSSRRRKSGGSRFRW
jgi:hypothetical protein